MLPREDAVSPAGERRPGWSTHSCLTGVPAAKLDGRVAHVRHALAVLLVAQVHAVRVPVAAPAQGDAQAVHPALELIGVAPSGGPSGCRGGGDARRCLTSSLALLQKQML